MDYFALTSLVDSLFVATIELWSYTNFTSFFTSYRTYPVFIVPMDSICVYYRNELYILCFLSQWIMYSILLSQRTTSVLCLLSQQTTFILCLLYQQTTSVDVMESFIHGLTPIVHLGVLSYDAIESFIHGLTHYT